ncbi:hypothetical protein MNEG_0298 [Monoraphidium neglectum]|uniref:Methyltransferase FkbM domain-containing protein n=1 Tax=Monoraphidium neglectum TaxID=145388 RepID=A0A0D2LN37_9CHLO|nr:hypothetical protein MNEG_0298 [Monoraphidium neglectum]KIZ07659.1 hypothetical protein MNEG_0298 [Monoraphidium neglectum]|eukprot:XP_013906678.1 hypothetical protein MNEG_0298 [Monoraphidium neglectum]
MRSLMQVHQELFCSGGRPDVDVNGSARVKRMELPKFSLFMYDGHDIVSDHMKGGGWEKEEIDEMLWALEAKVPPAGTPVQGKLPPARTWAKPSRPLMVEVGANVGWFTVNAAAAGADVAAFEAMSENTLLMRNTLCDNPKLAARVALHGTGLGSRRSTCHMISGDGNLGDGLSICDRDPQVDIKAQAKAGHTYLLRGEMTTMRLDPDSLLDEEVQVLKMDIESFELDALRGASGLMRHHNVWFMIIECNVGMIGEAAKIELMTFIDNLGYAISNRSFRGPWIDPAQISNGTTKLDRVSLFAVKKTWKAAQDKVDRRLL